MIVCHKYKFIFIKSVKTAGSSVEQYLQQFCADADIVTTGPRQGNVKKSFRSPPLMAKPLARAAAFRSRRYLADAIESLRGYRYTSHMTAATIRDRLPRSVWRDYYKFTIDRNPWDKTLSHLHFLNHQRGLGLTLESYITRGRFCFNYPFYLSPFTKEVVVDQIVRYEDLEEEVNGVASVLGLPRKFEGSEYREKADVRKDRRPYQEVFSRDQAALIKNVFQREIRLLGYEF